MGYRHRGFRASRHQIGELLGLQRAGLPLKAPSGTSGLFTAALAGDTRTTRQVFSKSDLSSFSILFLYRRPARQYLPSVMEAEEKLAGMAL